MTKNPFEALPGGLGNNLGDYLREQRLLNKLSLRQLSALAGISNPYLSQIERGVKRPSADILQQIAKGLSISAETLYVQAGLLDPKDAVAEAGATTRAAIRNDPALTARQRQSLLEIYESFVGGGDDEAAEPVRPTPRSRATQREARRSVTEKKATPKKAARTSAPKAPAKSSSGTSATKTGSTPAGQKPAGQKKATKASAKKATQKKTSGASSAGATASSTHRNTRS